MKLLGLIGAAVLLATPASAEPRRGQPVAVLSGEVVSDTTEAKPIAGARVAIWEAGPREGPGYYCPSCYRDCGRSVQTDEHGRFSLEHLDDTLKFKLLVTAEGFAPLLTLRLQNPSDGPLMGDKALRLKPREWSEFKPRQVLRGRVVEKDGTPVPGAVVEAWMVMNEDGTGSGGAVDGLDPVAVTDAEGLFRMAYSKPTDRMSVTVIARGMARAVYRDLVTGDKPHDLTVTEGAAVSGRLVRDGQPVPDIEVGLFDARRGIDDQAHEEIIATDARGGFSFAAIRPNRDYWVYTKMDSAKHLGAAAVKKIHIAADGSAQDVGDLEMKPTLRVAGQVVAESGDPLPKGRIFLSNMDAWDDQIFETGPDGNFSFEGVPAGKYDLSYTCGGKLMVSSKNASCPFKASGRLEGRIDADTLNLRVLVAPPEQGEARIVQMWEKPLEGVEP
jgi:protocatechuate 3,4-dioxygenase beta subunit